MGVGAILEKSISASSTLMHFWCRDKLNFTMPLASGGRVAVLYSWVNKLHSKLFPEPLELNRRTWGDILMVFIKSSQANADKAIRAYSFFIGTSLKTHLSNWFVMSSIILRRFLGVRVLSRKPKQDNSIPLYTMWWKWLGCKRLYPRFMACFGLTNQEFLSRNACTLWIKVFSLPY